MTFRILRRRRGTSMVVGTYCLLPMEGVGERFRARKNKVFVIIAVASLSHDENTKKGNQERTHGSYAVLIHSGVNVYEYKTARVQLPSAIASDSLVFGVRIQKWLLCRRKNGAGRDTNVSFIQVMGGETCLAPIRFISQLRTSSTCTLTIDRIS
ncbi:hypothetical protein ARMGADRAFT_339285 [Armillaria gallica]|uniref:Uncharacterized protein n=1 Tax=Armillaria gallica TaxID=47427 RepID=A0A2H3D1X7_ARMGA|nr:hypothetical protein ARMGADRAFT_339285 [Armillaria gallica]